MTLVLPRLYSFRRCPYAMRARLSILFAGCQIELREIVLKNKPKQMLDISPKGTVPILQIIDEFDKTTVLEESLDIIFWALDQNDPQQLLNPKALYQAHDLIMQNDNDFKYWLNRYKYADRYLEMTQSEYRQKGEVFLNILDNLLSKNNYLLTDHVTIADISIMPFIRQFAHVDRDTFYRLPYPNLQRWLKNWLEHPLFRQAMIKFQPWQEGDDMIVFPKPAPTDSEL